MKKTLMAALVLGALCARADETKPVSDARVRQLQDLRFGMFICWSFSTFSGREWTPGVTNLDLFAATECDTEQWVRTAKDAGMGYILFLAKHHDGFCLWDTATTGRKVTKAALRRDVLADLRKSCDRHGIKLALYFSEGEWAWPDKPGGGRYPANGCHNPGLKKAQLRELLTGYGPVEYIWFDHAVGDGGLSHADTIAYCKSLQPECFVGFNHGDQEGADIRLGEMGRPGPLADQAAAGPHMKNPGARSYRLAEFTYPILPKHQGGAMWFYSLPKHDNLCLPAEKIYADYLGAVRCRNIFSLDVGPDYRGRIRDIDVKTLGDVGAMIRSGAPWPELSATVNGGAKAAASGEWGAGYEAAQAVDGDASTRWGAQPGSRAGWLEVDLGAEKTIGRAVVIESAYPRTRKFAIEYKAGASWERMVAGTTIDGRREYEFPQVTARTFRLNILEAAEVPTIEEFQLLGPAPKGNLRSTP